MTVRRTRKAGFTLVEILIVVIILGILAAIVIPQFTSASQDARKNSLTSQLQTLRSQIELYKLQHLDQLPSTLVGAHAELGSVHQQDEQRRCDRHDVGLPVRPVPPVGSVNSLNGSRPSALSRLT